MTMPMHRRSFLGATAGAFAALAASSCTTTRGRGGRIGYGALVPDPNGLVDLPQGFSYRVISQLGEAMSDGFTVPDAADGMGCFDLPGGKLALVRNHELVPGRGDAGGVMGRAYDYVAKSLVPLPGGTTTIVLDARTLAVEKQYRSLAGTLRNCAGGITPWGTWLTCEEAVVTADARVGKDHGWVFEVPAAAPGLIDPVPLKAMGRFNHEAACVDPRTGIVYLTEDRDDSLLYRFIPAVRGRLAEGGKLQALVLADGIQDARNWGGVAFAPHSWHPVRWIDMSDVEAPKDDLRMRGAAAGAARFARGEGIWMGEGELYFACTSGGTAKLGQIFRLDVSRPADKLQLFFESTSADQFNYGDNLTIAPWGDLIVCEDQYTDVVDNHLRGIAPSGVAYPLARSRVQTEWAGACFSPDGRTLFVNLYHPTKTLAITGPWV
ncbi:MAG: alkaline phosphatase PhoX [Cypionkella sp.]